MQNFRAAHAAIDSKKHKTVTRARRFKLARGISEARSQPPQLDEQLDDLGAHSTVNERAFWSAVERLAIEDDLAPEAALVFGGESW